MLRRIPSLLVCFAFIVRAVEAGSSTEACSFPVSSTQQAGSSRELLDNLKRCLDQSLSAKGFSGAVLVANRDGIQLQGAYGSGITSGTRFYIASISKQFTAAAIMKLAEQGRLKVDDEISKYLSNVPADKTHITIHQLLTHTSGIPQQYAADGITDREKAVQAVLAEPLKSAPQKEFGYSNDGYSLLAALVEIVARMPFETFVRQNLLQPAGLSETGFWGETIQSGAAIASTLKKINTTPNWGFRGATGMFSTTGDLYKWTRALLGYRVLSKTSTSQMLRAYVTTSRGGHGYGWFTSKTRQGVDDVWTAGYEDFGLNGIINVYATGDIGVVLTNSGDIAGKPARDLASQQIESVLLGGSNCNSGSEQASALVKRVVPSGSSGNVQRPTTGLVPRD